MSFFDFLTTRTFHRERAQNVMEKLLKDEFIYQLKDDNTLSIISSVGRNTISTAVTMDRKRNSLIIAEKSPQGRLLLERNEPVTVVTQANAQHEIFSFKSKVSSIIMDDSDILYEIAIPKRIEKGQRRKDFRVNIDSPSRIKISHSVYEGQLSNISTAGVLFTLDGYWPEPVEQEDSLLQCDIDMNFMSFNCNIEVRYINFEPYPGRRTYLGGKIKNIQPLYQHQLDNFLSSQQRIEQRKKAELRLS